MSFINGSQLAGTGATPAFEFERPQPGMQQSNFSTTAMSANDGFASNSIALPAQYGENYGNSFSNSNTSASYSPDQNTNSFYSTVMNGFSNVINQIMSMFGSGSSSSTGTSASAGNASYAGTGYTTSPTTTQVPEDNFTSVTASSTGDPHEALNGTTSGGATVSDKWDSMKAHGDLLDSDSFHGGYQVSTTTTTPNAQGVTYNASATVTTGNGNDSVTLNKDGSYAVTENGQNVTLTQGQAVKIGRDETVTLNADKSLTITDTNKSGASLTTTLSLNGNGVDVNASGSNVDLGGYLVNKTDRDVNPVAYAPQYNGGGYVPYNGASPSQLDSAYNDQAYQNQYAGTATSPYQYASETEPLGAGEIEFA